MVYQASEGSVEIAGFENLVRDSKFIVVDLETTKLNPNHGGKVAVAGFFFPEKGKFAVFLTEEFDSLALFDSDNIPPVIPWQEITKVLRSLTSDKVLIAHNAKFDVKFFGFVPSSYVFCTLLASHLIDENQKKTLSALEEKYLKTMGKHDYKRQLAGKLGRDTLNLSPSLLLEYCRNDCFITWQLFKIFKEKLREMELIGLFNLLERYLKVLIEVENTGIAFNKDYWKKALEKEKERLSKLEERLYKELGKNPLKFNWRSPKQLSMVLYGKEILSTAGSVLKGKEKHPLADLIIELRESDKSIALLTKWEEYVNNGRIYTTFNITGTKTGRLSSENPNMQNVPPHLRKCFISPPGKKLVSLDYEQMEIRMFALLAKEQRMIDYLQEGKDLHLEVAEEVFGEKNEKTRSLAKSIIFGLIYGMGPSTLASNLNISMKRAEELQKRYLKKFPRIKEWMKEVVDEMKRKGEIRYWSGRKRRIKDKAYYYKAVNSVIQGSCADFLAKAIVELDKYLKERRLNTKIVNLIHDEVLLEMPDEEYIHLDEFKAILEQKEVFRFPFTVEVKIGNNWGEMR